MTNTTDPASHQPGTPPPAIEVRGLGFAWQKAQPTLHFPDFTLPQGEHLFVHGPSGTGKSTLLSLLAGMLQPAEGRVHLQGTDLYRLKTRARDRFRADHLGVIFQHFNLVPYLTARGNATLPCRLSARRRDLTEPGAGPEAERLLASLAIPEDHWHRKVNRLSIGQQQRVAAARALIGAPGIILADEPTSALDTDNRDRFLDLLLELADRHATSVLFVSHDHTLASHFHHHLELGGSHG